MPDKGVSTAIEYNYLNLPEKIVQSGNATEYTYRSDGEKLQKTFTINSQNIYTDYLDGFVYTSTFDVGLQQALTADDSVTRLATTAHQEESLTLDDKIVLPIRSSPELAFFPTSEGFYDFENSVYIYQYKDHLGNVRLSYSRNSSGEGVTIKDMNSYYPFGMSFLKNNMLPVLYDPMSIPYNYKWSNKELQEFGGYDFGARIYSPDAPHWWQIDNFSDAYHSLSPYGYVANNPIKNIDINGEWIYIYDENFTT